MDRFDQYVQRIAYQLDFTTPGRLPLRASCRKQIRHRPKRRIYPRERPHILQRLRTRTEYLRLVSRATIDFFATELSPNSLLAAHRLNDAESPYL